MYFYPDGSSDGPGANSYKFYKGIRTVELSGWGNRDGNWLNAGSHKIEIWFDGLKIYQQNFSVTND